MTLFFFFFALVQYGHESKWMAMIDVDEFLLAGDGQTKDIKEVLDHFDYEKGTVVADSPTRTRGVSYAVSGVGL